MKKVLWLSRHSMTEDQKQGLTKVFNGQVQVEVLDETINEETITKLVDLGYDAYAVVLPAGLLSKFFLPKTQMVGNLKLRLCIMDGR